MSRLVALLVFMALIVQPAAAQDAVILYNEGLQLKADKKYPEAKEKFLSALQLKPGYPEALFELGWCENETREYSKAINHLKELAIIWPDMPKVFFELGYAYEKLGNADSAVIAYNRCLLFKPDYLNASKQLAGIAYEQKNYALALEHYNKVLSRTNAEIKDYLFWYRKGFCENAREDYVSAKTSLLNALQYKSDDINTLLELGFASYKQKNSEEAIQYYKKVIELEPKNHIPYNGIGDVYRDNMKNVEEAMTWYKKTLEINPKQRKANFGMGYCLNNQGRCEEAIPYLKTAIESESNYTVALVELGYSFYKTDNYDEAIDHLQKAINLNTKNVNAWYYLGLVYIKQKNKEKATLVAEELKNMGSKFGDDLKVKIASLQLTAQ
jgi:tetratricopeptide (TPR) repeat protein